MTKVIIPGRERVAFHIPQGLVAAGCLLLAAGGALAQGKTPGKAPGGPPGMPPAQVRYTEAREHALRRSLTLPGTVEAQTTSVVAATVPGLVMEFPAKEGTRVKRGDVLARLRTVTLELTRDARAADLKEAEARQQQAQNNLRRAKELFEATVVSKEVLDDRQSEYNAWLGRTESLKAEIARIEDEIDRCTVRAPLNGVVSREMTEVGQWLVAGGPVVEVLALDQVEVRVDVPERYFGQIRDGATASLTFSSLPSVRAQGRVFAVIPKADPQARTFPVKVLVPNERGGIGAGMLAEVSFAAGDVYSATVVPKDAVISEGGRRFLYKLNGDNTVEMVAVETGAGAGVWIEVRGGVRPGDKVVTRGNERLMPGQPAMGTPLEYQRP